MTTNNINIKNIKLKDVKNWIQYASVFSDERLYKAFIKDITNKLIERKDLDSIMELLKVLNDFMKLRYTIELHDAIKKFINDFESSDRTIITIKYVRSFDDSDEIVDNGFITINEKKGSLIDLMYHDKEICGTDKEPLL